MTLRIYDVSLDMIRDVARLAPGIERQDHDLARQLRRAASSVPLNLSEGMYSRGKNRSARYHTAMGSAREVLACFEVAQAMGYVATVHPDVIARLNRLIGTLVRLVKPRG